MAFWDQKIGIKTLMIDESNPRSPRVKDQEEAIDQMLRKYESKIRKIARHISDYGLNPSTVPIVFRTSEGKYIVKDGNRRITAIKCMMYPEKVKNNPGLKKYLSDLGGKLDRADFQLIACRVSDDEEEINRWVEVNHQGEQGGIGQTRWNTMSRYRHLKSMGVPQPTLDLFDHLQKNLSYDFDEDTFNITTFERLIESTAFRKAMGMDVTEKEIVFDRPEEEWIRDFEVILNDMTSDKGTEDHITSRTIDKTENIEEYIRSKRAKGYFEKADEPTETVIAIDRTERIPEKGSRRKRIGRPQKTTLIAAECDIYFPKTRMNDLFRDLKELDLKKYSNSVSTIFRTFIEIVTKYYYECMAKPFGHAEDRHVKFPDRVKAILEHLRKSNAIKDDVRKAVELTLNNSKELLQEFAEFGHNYEYNPTPESLMTTWNSLSSFVSAMYPYPED